MQLPFQRTTVTHYLFHCNSLNIITKFFWEKRIKKQNCPDHQQLVRKSMWWPLWQPFNQKEMWLSAAIRSHKAGAHAWKSQAQQSHSWHATSGLPDWEGHGDRRVGYIDSRMQNLMTPMLTPSHIPKTPEAWIVPNKFLCSMHKWQQKDDRGAHLKRFMSFFKAW